MLRQLVSYLQTFGRSRKMTSATKSRSLFERRIRLTVELLERRDVPSGIPPVTMINPGNQTNYDGDVVDLAIVANDTTPGATLAYSDSGLPSGLSMDAGTGVVTGTISTNADLSSPSTVTFTAADGSASASRTITWVVNSPVVLTSPGDQTNYDGDTVNLAISASDAKGTVAYSAAGLPPGLSMDPSSGIISGTIGTTADTNGPYTVTIAAGDGTYSASQTVNWAVNNPVTVTNPGSQTNYDGDTVDVAISASDANGGTLAFSASGLPAGVSIDSSTGIITGTIAANADANGPYTVTITADDSTYSASQTINWVINDPVTLTNPGSQTDYKDDQIDLALSASDAKGGTVAYSATNLPLGLTIDPTDGIIVGGTIYTGGSSTTTTITATDGTYSASQTFPWTVSPYPVALAHVPLQFDAIGDSVDLQVSASNQTSATLTFSATGLPPGLNIDASSGVISGTISSSADTSVPYFPVVTAAAGNFSDSKALTITVNQQQVAASLNFYVNTLQDTNAVNAANGPADQNGFVSLRSAIQCAIATPNASIVNIYFDNDLSGTLSLTSPLPRLQGDYNISGPASGDVTITRGFAANLRASIFWVESGVCSINNLTMTNGSNPIGGGGIIVSGRSTLNLYNCTLYGNEGRMGGAISNAGNITIENCTVYGNEGYWDGGGIATFENTWISDSEIMTNLAERQGGGIWLASGNLNLFNVEIYSNWLTAATSVGGGIENRRGTLLMSGGILYDNAAVSAGGGYYGSGQANADFSAVAITGNNVTGNQSQGGGIYIGGEATLTFCLISGNSVGPNGVGNAGARSNGATLTLIFCISIPWYDTFSP